MSSLLYLWSHCFLNKLLLCTHVYYCIEELQLGVPSPLASDCGSLIPPLNGMIETSGTKFGDFAEYSCIPGFSLVGERTRTCGHSGVWSGVDPVCLRKY